MKSTESKLISQPTKDAKFYRRRPVIQTLSLVWFVLCASLVVKQNDLIAVFFAFVWSFLLAILISYKDAKSVIKNCLGIEGSELSATQQSKNTRTKAIVGIITSSFSLITLGTKYVEAFSRSEKDLLFKSDFHALCIMAGYLAFDLWCDRMCCRQIPPRLLTVTEDATTLSVLCAILAKWNEWDFSSSAHAIPAVAIFTAYKIIKFSLQILDENRRLVSNEIDSMAMTETKGSKEMEKESVWTIHGMDYDLSDFVERHPGGKESILLGRGRDCTALFESYHPFTNRHRDVLKKYKPVIDVSKREGKCNVEDDKFYEVLKERVIKTLKENNIDPITDRGATTGRSLYYMCIFVSMITSGSYHVKGNPLGSFLFAVFGWLLGAIGHDGGHFAVSRIPLLNDVGVWGISFLCNPIMWQHQHTYAHHSYTNDFDHDPDLHHFSIFLKVHRKFQNESIYKNQKSVFFVFFAYAFVVFGECIKIPMEMMKTGWLYGMVEFTDKKRKAIPMYLHYGAYMSLIVLSPFFSGKSFLVSISCVLIHIVVAGWLFAIFSQINHLNEFSIDIVNGETKDKKMLENSWAAQQVTTSNNFATNSFFWHIFSNGLNMQIEHHLFPGLNHCHLHVIQPTVQATCEEFRIHYKSFESWPDIMSAALKWLEKLSEE